MMGIFYKRRQRHRERIPLKTEAEALVKLLPAKDHPGPPDTGRSKEGSCLRAIRGRLALPIPTSSLQDYDWKTLSWQPRKHRDMFIAYVYRMRDGYKVRHVSRW